VNSVEQSAMVFVRRGHAHGLNLCVVVVSPGWAFHEGKKKAFWCLIFKVGYLGRKKNGYSKIIIQFSP
jgi:hypothetical protein